MSTKRYLTAVIFFATTLLTSCSGIYVIYSVNNITLPSETAESIPINVNVKTLTDNRANIENNKILFTNNSRDATIDNKVYCINLERDYEAVAAQVTEMMVKHFNKAKLFTNASYNDETGADYYLTGTLNSFYGTQEMSTGVGGGAVVGAVVGGILFGAIGGAIAGTIASTSAAKSKTPGKIIIELSDLMLFKKDGTLIKDFGSYHKEFTGNFPVDANCRCIYENVNAKLRDFNTELIEKIRAELVGVTF